MLATRERIGATSAHPPASRGLGLGTSSQIQLGTGGFRQKNKHLVCAASPTRNTAAAPLAL